MIFNSPLEVSLRILIILEKVSPNECDLQNLIYLDYFTLYPSDSPAHNSIVMHTHTPYRGTEIIVRRKVMQDSLLLLLKKGLIKKKFSPEGIKYKTTKVTTPFLKYFDSDYYKKFEKIAELIVKGLSDYSFQYIDEYVKKNISNWGPEFTSESLFREDNIE